MDGGLSMAARVEIPKKYATAGAVTVLDVGQAEPITQAGL